MKDQRNREKGNGQRFMGNLHILGMRREPVWLLESDKGWTTEATVHSACKIEWADKVKLKPLPKFSTEKNSLFLTLVKSSWYSPSVLDAVHTCSLTITCHTGNRRYSKWLRTHWVTSDINFNKPVIMYFFTYYPWHFVLWTSEIIYFPVHRKQRSKIKPWRKLKIGLSTPPQCVLISFLWKTCLHVHIYLFLDSVSVSSSLSSRE